METWKDLGSGYSAQFHIVDGFTLYGPVEPTKRFIGYTLEEALTFWRAKLAECGSCGLEWCAECDPAPSALCPACNGRGYAMACTGDHEGRI